MPTVTTGMLQTIYFHSFDSENQKLRLGRPFIQTKTKKNHENSTQGLNPPPSTPNTPHNLNPQSLNCPQYLESRLIFR